MKKKILIIFIILVLFFTAAVIYLNRVILPVKIKSLVVNAIEDFTRKKATLSSLQFHVLKGLVLNDLSIYDGTETLLNIKEASCSFLIWPVFKKQIIIPVIKINSPIVSIERKEDNSLNILEPFINKPSSEKTSRSKFNIFIYKILITGGVIDFKDNTLKPVFTKRIEDINLKMQLALPSKIKFNLNMEIPADNPMAAISSGEYNIAQKELSAKIRINNLSAGEFSAYYNTFGIAASSGKVDALINLNLKEKLLNFNLEVLAKEIAFFKDKIQGRLTSTLTADCEYDLGKNKQLKYSGNLNIINLDISGIELIGNIDDIRAYVKFDNSGLSSDNLNASLSGAPIQARINLTDFKNPLINASLSSNFDFDILEAVLKNRFLTSTTPIDLSGQGRLHIDIQQQFSDKLPQVNGTLDISDGKINYRKANVDNINGGLKFTQDDLTWSDLGFSFLDSDYKTSGNLINFKAPELQLKLTSKDLDLESVLRVIDKQINLSRLNGRYLNSDFYLSANIGLNDTAKIDSDITADLNIELDDIKGLLKGLKVDLEKANPQGRLHIDGNINGNVKDIKLCTIKAKVSGDSLSFYGLKSKNFALEYNQDKGIGDIGNLSLFLYDGIISGMGKINFAIDDVPYGANIAIQGVKIEKLKMDTQAKDKDISGVINAQAKISGFSSDLSKLRGEGWIVILDGKLWQLDLLKGLGALIFTKDFSNIIFTEGRSDFLIKDSYISTNNMILKSNLTNITGAVKIGFDNSIDATLDVDLSTEKLPLSDSIKGIASTIIGDVLGNMVSVRITGTLKEPKYKPVVGKIIDNIKDIFLGK